MTSSARLDPTARPPGSTFGALRRGRLAGRALAAVAAVGLAVTIVAWFAAAARGRPLGSPAEHLVIHLTFAAVFGAILLRALCSRKDRRAWALLAGAALAAGASHALWGGGVGDLQPVPQTVGGALHLAALALACLGISTWRAPHRLVVADRLDAAVWAVVVATLGGLLVAGQMLDGGFEGGVVEGLYIAGRAAGSITLLVVAALVVAPGIWSGGTRRLTMLAAALALSLTELVATLRTLTSGATDDAFPLVGWLAALAWLGAAAWQRERQAGVTWSTNVQPFAVPTAVSIVAIWALVGVASGRSPWFALLPPLLALGAASTRIALLLRDELRGEVPKTLPAAAMTDPLTGLPGHRAFMESLSREFDAARASGRPLALALLDIDDFTDLNETFGHPEGDRVLAGAALRLARLVRSSDLVARVGSDQFAWLLRGTDGFNAWRAAERVRAEIADAGSAGHAITVSIGVSDVTVVSSAADLYRFAENALGWARANGSNLTVAYSPEVVGPTAPARQGRESRAQTLNAVRVLARAVDAKLPGTRRHSERVARVAGLLAEELGWTARRIADLREAALVHNVGKVGVPDAVLAKPGRLSEDEYALVMAHAALGADIVAGVLEPQQVAWVRGHHERFDGTGYPDRLSGDAIPEGARLIAVADAWDAMTAPRPHRPALSAREVLAEFRLGSGGHWDPEVVSALIRLWDRGVLTIESPDAVTIRTGSESADMEVPAGNR